MEKFGVIQIKGDSIRTLLTCTDKEAAFAAERRLSGEHGPQEGLLCVVSGDFDKNDRLTAGKFRLY